MWITKWLKKERVNINEIDIYNNEKELEASRHMQCFLYLLCLYFL
jgi:hypothetical protein